MKPCAHEAPHKYGDLGKGGGRSQKSTNLHEIGFQVAFLVRQAESGRITNHRDVHFFFFFVVVRERNGRYN